MSRTRGMVEEDEDSPRLVLSMRLKLFLGCLVFVLVMGIIAYLEMPNAVQALISLGQSTTLAENESQPPEQEEPQEPPQGQETIPQGIGGASRSGILIEADGSVNPPTAPILRDGNVYTLVSNIYYETVWVERDNIVIDGAGLWVMGFEDLEVGLIHSLPSNRKGIVLAGMRNVTIKNLTITGFRNGIRVGRDSCVITDCTIRGLQDIRENWEFGGSGIYSEGEVYNLTIRNVKVTSFRNGISLWDPETCVIVHNNVSNNGKGIIFGIVPWGIDDWGNNIVVGNMVTNNSVGISIDNRPNGSSQSVHHNTFIDNDIQADISGDISGAIWDDGPRSGGNYWNDYTGHDKDGDGIGDSPYILKTPNPPGYREPFTVVGEDRYPLMKPWTGVPECALLPILVLNLLPILMGHSREN